eukprot:866845_1
MEAGGRRSSSLSTLTRRDERLSDTQRSSLSGSSSSSAGVKVSVSVDLSKTRFWKLDLVLEKLLKGGGIFTPRIFREAGDEVEIRLLSDCSREFFLNVHGQCSIHSLASFVKRALRSMDPPLVQSKLSELALDHCGDKDKLRRIFYRLHPEELVLLAKLIFILMQMQSHPDAYISQNTADTLAYCLGPCIFRTDALEVDMKADSSKVKSAMVALKTCIESFDTVFPFIRKRKSETQNLRSSSEQYRKSSNISSRSTSRTLPRPVPKPKYRLQLPTPTVEQLTPTPAVEQLSPTRQDVPGQYGVPSRPAVAPNYNTKLLLRPRFVPTSTSQSTNNSQPAQLFQLPSDSGIRPKLRLARGSRRVSPPLATVNLSSSRSQPSSRSGSPESLMIDIMMRSPPSSPRARPSSPFGPARRDSPISDPRFSRPPSPQLSRPQSSPSPRFTRPQSSSHVLSLTRPSPPSSGLSRPPPHSSGLSRASPPSPQLSRPSPPSPRFTRP